MYKHLRQTVRDRTIRILPSVSDDAGMVISAARGVHVEDSPVTGQKMLTIIDHLGVTRVRCMIDIAWWDEGSIALAYQELETHDPIPSDETLTHSIRLGVMPADASVLPFPSVAAPSPRSDQAGAA